MADPERLGHYETWRIDDRWMEFDLTKMFCADCSVGQDPTYGGD